MQATNTEGEYRIHFEAYYQADELANFLLINRWQRVAAFNQYLTHLTVIIQGPRTVKPHHVTTFACLLEEYHLAGVPISFEDGGSIVYPYLQSIGFFERWVEGAEKDTNFSVPATSNSFILWKAAQEDMTAYARSAYQHYQTGFFSGKNLTFLETYLAEIFNNVCDHAFTPDTKKRVAFGMLQYYPSRKRLFVAVSDFGMGIPNSVNHFLVRNGLEALPAVEAIRKALELRFTSQSQPYNQGRGLDILRTGLRGLGGTLTIQTSHGIYHVSEAGKEFYNSLPQVDFPGTTVSLRIFYDKLQPEETDVLEDDVDLF